MAHKAYIKLAVSVIIMGSALSGAMVLAQQPSEESLQMQSDYELCAAHGEHVTGNLPVTQRAMAYMYFYNGCMTGRGYDMSGAANLLSGEERPAPRAPVRQNRPPTTQYYQQYQDNDVYYDPKPAVRGADSDTNYSLF